MAGYICGFYYTLPHPTVFGQLHRQYLPQVHLQAHTTILSTTSRTTLTQTFINPSESKGIKELKFTFPLYDGVSVVGFRCRVGERVIIGEVKEKEKAKAVYQEAVARGQTAGLLEQLPDASDVFTTTVGNVPPGASLVTEITYLGELKHDAEVDGIRFTIPTLIAPRYGSYPGQLASGAFNTNTNGKGIQVTVDVEMPQNSFIRQIRSPSHPISVTMGNTSVAPAAEPRMSSASATLSLGSAELDTDFVLQVVANDTGIPNAILEIHPTIPNQRALMATLVPKFSLPPEKPEVVFICDRSGSMAGSKIPLVISALKVFLKSLPLGVKFNICSFGSSFSFLWSKSKAYSQSSLDEAIKHVEGFQANFGGTEMFQPIKATLERRYKDIPLEVMLLTDGEIWDQTTLFTYLNKEVIESKASIRVFTLGIGNGVSHALIEGVARAGNGFSQAVGEGEKLDSKVVRMLKGALSPHVNDYSLEVKYFDDDSLTVEDEFEIIEKTIDSLNIKTTENKIPKEAPKKPISLFDTSVNLDKEEPGPVDDWSGQARYAHLPTIAVPALLQAPQNIPPLFAFNRTSVYLLMGPQSVQRRPKSVILRGTSAHGPLELEIPVQILDTPGESIHQLAAKKAISELEQGRGWLTEARDETQKLLKQKYDSRFEDMVEREAVRLGVQFQVGGKWCSFVAVESNNANKSTDGVSLPQVDWLDVPSSTVLPPLVQSQNYPQYAYANSHSVRTLSAQTGMDPTRARMSMSPSLYGNNSYQSKMRNVGGPPPPAPGLFGGSQNQTAGGGLFGSAQPQAFGSASSFGSSLGAPAPQSSKIALSAFGPTSQASYGSSLRSFPRPSTELCDAAPAAAAPISPPNYSAELEDTKSTIEKNLDSVLQRGERLDSLIDKTDALSSDAKNFSVGARKAKKSSSLFGSMFGGSPKPSTAVSSNNGSGNSWLQSSAGKPSGPARSKLDRLVDLQTFEGYWEWNDALFAVLGVSKEQVEKMKNSNKWGERVVVTALAVAFFEKKLASEKDAWELVVEKAKGWLEEQATGKADGIIGTVGALVV